MIFELSCIALCALLSVAVSWTRSPFMALMYAVLLFINASILLLIVGFEFLALVNLLVYVGALAVLFLFVIMLLEIPATELRAYARGWSPLALFGILACSKLTTLLSTPLFPLPHSVADCHTALPWGSMGEGVWQLGGWGDTELFLLSFAQPDLPTITFVPAMESINSLGEALYVHYSDVLILNSMVLTIALFGALVLAHIRSA